MLAKSPPTGPRFIKNHSMQRLIFSLSLLFVGILFLGASPAAPGPIRESKTADELVDSFESDPAAFRQSIRGAIEPRLSTRTGYSKHGSKSLLLEIPATGAEGRNSVLLGWDLDGADWTEWDGLSFWYQAQDEESPGLTAVLTEADGAQYWCKPSPLPRKAGEWQLVQLPFSSWSWSFEGPGDENKQFDRTGLRGLRFEIRGEPDKPVVFAIDGLGLDHEAPPYTGPKVTIGIDKGGWRRDPGTDFELSLNVSDLPAGKPAEVALTGRDFWGKELLSKSVTFTAPPGAERPAPVKVTLPGGGANYVDLAAALSMDGQPLFRAERAAGWLRAQEPEDQGPNPDSLFGIWVGGGPWQIGAKWSRMYLRGSDVELVNGQYVVRNGEPGVYQPKPDPRVNWTFYFSAMPKWLSSKPDRTDWQKWSPTSWEEYGKFVEFAVRGAYAGGVRHFEVWNEPVPYAYWMGPIESVVKLHEVTYQAVKRAAPDAVVLGPCPYSFVWDFLEEFFELGGGQYLDQVVIHAYGGNPDLEFVANLRRLRAMLKQYGLADKEIWITEKGFATPQFSERQQAHNLVKTYIYCLSEGVRLLTWHMLWDYTAEGDPAYAILRHDQTPRPAYCAYGAMTSVLERAGCAGPVSGLAESQRGFVFKKRGSTIRVLWETGEQPTTATVKSSAETAKRIDLLGGETPLTPSAPGRYELQLTLDPLYLVTREGDE